MTAPSAQYRVAASREGESVMLSSRPISLIPLIAAGVLLGGQNGAAGASSAGTACDTSKDAYSMTSSERSACGIETFPLIRVDQLKDGGKSYRYEIDGAEVWMNVPPPEFNAASATEDELETYGIPSAPSGVKASDWSARMAKSSFVLPPDYLVTVPFRGAEQHSENWAGFEALDDTFTTASVTYTEPIPQGCAGGSVAIWAGLGGRQGGNGELGQNGTAIGVPGLYTHEAWWAILPHSPVALPFGGNGGYQFYASTSFALATNRWTFYWYNYKTGLSTSAGTTNPRHDLSSAEAILERVSINGVPTDLKNFGQIGMAGDANLRQIGTFAHTRVQMYNNDTTLLSYTSPLFADNKSFSETWYACTGP
ncbi:MAG: G1 family endopeptidase [Chloroflexota bacterium]|nr:G1 family endopeptidase [Chloroflexota bacterium]